LGQIDAGDRLRVRHDGRHLLLERRREVLATVRLGVFVRVTAAGEVTTIAAGELGSPLRLEGREYRIRLSRGGAGDIRVGDVLIATLTMRHADHGSALAIDVVAPPSVHVLALAGAAAYANGLARRRKRRASVLWGKENALEDIIDLLRLDLRTGDHPGFDIGGFDGGGFDAGGGGGDFGGGGDGGGGGGGN
jgi:hypothetical protein